MNAGQNLVNENCYKKAKHHPRRKQQTMQKLTAAGSTDFARTAAARLSGNKLKLANSRRSEIRLSRGSETVHV